MKEPIEPSTEDCCSSGCNPCIFDVYQQQLLLYKKYQDRVQVPEEVSIKNAIDQLKYTQFIVMDNIQLCEEHHLIIFQVKSSDNNNRILWKPGSHFLIKYTSGDSCSRAYTPMKLRVQSTSEFSIIVKRYTQGIVSQYLCDLIKSQITLWRGPYNSYEIMPNKYDRIVMIAQGTGIAPFYSIIENILHNDDDMTKIILIYCCRNKEVILFRDELYSWRLYWNFTYTIYLGNGNKEDVYKYKEPVVNHKLDVTYLLSLMPYCTKDQFLLCGSAQFMEYYKEFLKNEKSENIILF